MRRAGVHFEEIWKATQAHSQVLKGDVVRWQIKPNCNLRNRKVCVFHDIFLFFLLKKICGNLTFASFSCFQVDLQQLRRGEGGRVPLHQDERVEVRAHLHAHQDAGESNLSDFAPFSQIKQNKMCGRSNKCRTISIS